MLQTETDVSQEKIVQLLNQPGILAADVLEGAHKLMLVIETAQRKQLVMKIEQALDSVESVTDLRFFIGRENSSRIPTTVGV